MDEDGSGDNIPTVNNQQGNQLQVRVDKDGSGDNIPRVNNQQRNQLEKIGKKEKRQKAAMCEQERGIHDRVRTVLTKNERKRLPALTKLKTKAIMEEEKRVYH